MRVPEYKKSAVEFEQEKLGFHATKWWQATDDRGLLAETSNPKDFLDLNLLNQEGVIFRRMYEKKELHWIEEHPFPPEVEWRAHPEFTLYEMTSFGVLRVIKTKETVYATIIGDEGSIGFLLKKGIGVHLKLLSELHNEIFPELMKDETDVE